MDLPYVVIMAGGRGERFWPKSRLKKPKHLLSIFGTTSMLQQTLKRVEAFVPRSHIFIITQKEQKSLILEEIPSLLAEQIITEPFGRDTAAAISLALAWIKIKNPNSVFCVLPADHMIHATDAFLKTLKHACQAAYELNGLITIGIPPTYPATGYGYIEKNNILTLPGMDVPIYEVKQFVEKPTASIAKTYIDSGHYYWNAGMFIWKTQVLEAAFKKHSPIHSTFIDSLTKHFSENTLTDAILNAAYETLPKMAIDYAIMEKAHPIYTLEATFDWDDVGEWTAIERHHTADTHGNCIQGTSCLMEANNNTVIGENNHLIALLGVDNLIVIHTPDATLICPKERAQDIKKIVKKLESENSPVI